MDGNLEKLWRIFVASERDERGRRMEETGRCSSPDVEGDSPGSGLFALHNSWWDICFINICYLERKHLPVPLQASILKHVPSHSAQAYKIRICLSLRPVVGEERETLSS